MKRQYLHIILALCWLLGNAHVFAQAVVTGERVDIATERQAPVALEINELGDSAQLPPFGANLFQGGSFSAEREDGLNPEYIIQPGDRIGLRIWGAADVNEVAVVDAQGNIFVPNVGPIRVEGVRNGQLNTHIKSAVERVFTQNINVYTNLQSTTPVLVYVTGFVKKPGAFAGVASDSLLYFLERAGGIDHRRGSFRNIRVLRDNKEFDRADLYDFLLHGRLPRPQFTDGDTIVIERKGDTVTVDGAVRNAYTFELTDQSIQGNELIEFARPQANATYATVLGTRNGIPFSGYVPLDDFMDKTLQDGDQVVFEVDQVHDTIIVRVEGSHIGQSRFAVPRDTRLTELLDYIKVEPELADLDAISLRRESIRQRQKQALQESLNRLETAILGRTALTPEGAEIQAAEAQLIADFVKRARQVEPQGILVVSKDGEVADVLLQPDDIITIPEKTRVIQVSGEVMVPQALVYETGNTLQDYIERVGGYTERADEKRHMILRRNGEVVPVFDAGKNIAIRPGDEIISLPEVPSKNVDIIRLVTDVIFKVASSAALFVRLF